MLKKIFLCILGFIFLLSFVSCSVVERIGVKMSGPFLVDAVDKMMTLKSTKLAKEGLPSNVLLISALVEFAPTDRRMLTIASQAYTSYALFVEESDPEYAKELYTLAKEYGLRALEQSLAFREAKGPSRILEAVKDVGPKYLKALTWTGVSWGQLVNLKNAEATALMDMPNVVALIERAQEIDGAYFYGVSHIFFGAYYASLPALLGGGPEKAEKEFEIAREITDGKCLLADVFYAKFYATLLKDEVLFEKTLNHVLDASSDLLPEAVLINELAKQKARWLLEHKHEYF